MILYVVSTDILELFKLFHQGSFSQQNVRICTLKDNLLSDHKKSPFIHNSLNPTRKQLKPLQFYDLSFLVLLFLECNSTDDSYPHSGSTVVSFFNETEFFLYTPF